MRIAYFLATTLCLAAPAAHANNWGTRTHGDGWTYWRLGNPNDVTTATTGGVMFEGGGTDVNDGYRWMCGHAGNGDFLVLRAYGTGDYDPYIQRLCPGINSVSTLKLGTPKASTDPFVLKTIAQAEAIFIAGGDQTKYVHFWQGTPVQAAINAAAARGVPVGGTSAGNAILAQFAFSALYDTILSKAALADCFARRITIDDGFLNLSPLLANLITDDHFITRNRMGRLVTFLAHIEATGQSTQAAAIAVNEHTAFLMEPSGAGTVVGSSKVFFLRPPGPPQVCAAGTPVTYNHINVYRIERGGTFNLGSWAGTGGTAYSISATAGVLTSTQKGGKIY